MTKRFRTALITFLLRDASDLVLCTRFCFRQILSVSPNNKNMICRVCTRATHLTFTALNLSIDDDIVVRNENEDDGDDA